MPLQLFAIPIASYSPESGSICTSQNADTKYVFVLHNSAEEAYHDNTNNSQNVIYRSTHSSNSPSPDNNLSNPGFKTESGLLSPGASGTNSAELDDGNVKPPANESITKIEEQARAERISSLDRDYRECNLNGRWDFMFQELCEFRSREGHCLVPMQYEENPRLASWVKRQRWQYKLLVQEKHNTMTEERIIKLEDIGFVWDSQEVSWWNHLNDLKEFKDKHGHCNVPSMSSPHQQPLATWVKSQRRQYKLSKSGKPTTMTPIRVEELGRLGFVWSFRRHKPKEDSAASYF